jgi:hypothetical protein
MEIKMETNEIEEFEEIIKSTPLDELEAMCKLLAAGHLVKNMNQAGSMSVEVLNTLHSDPVHTAAMKSLYQNILVVVSKPLDRTDFGDKITYTVNNKGRKFLEYRQKQMCV